MSHQERAMPCPARGGVLGIIGGMGPAATADFLVKLTQLTPAGFDQDRERYLLLAEHSRSERSHPCEWTQSAAGDATLTENAGAKRCKLCRDALQYRALLVRLHTACDDSSHDPYSG